MSKLELHIDNKKIKVTGSLTTRELASDSFVNKDFAKVTFFISNSLYTMYDFLTKSYLDPILKESEIDKFYSFQFNEIDPSRTIEVAKTIFAISDLYKTKYITKNDKFPNYSFYINKDGLFIGGKILEIVRDNEIYKEKFKEYYNYPESIEIIPKINFDYGYFNDCNLDIPSDSTNSNNNIADNSVNED